MWVLLAIIALALGIYVGLGLPGMPGRVDRVVSPGRARRLRPNHIHWFRPSSRASRR